MNTDDDPEARIRELERPLSDLAEAAELTASPPRGNRSWITVAVGVLAAVVVIVAAAAVFLFSGGSTSTTPRHPTNPSGAAPTLSRAPASAPRGSTPTTPVPDHTITILGAEESRTVACTGSYVSVSGVRNTVVLTGHCAGLTVSGIDNVITVDSTPTITTSGIRNRVTYRFGDPELSTSGIDNVVEHG